MRFDLTRSEGCTLLLVAIDYDRATIGMGRVLGGSSDRSTRDGACAKWRAMPRSGSQLAVITGLTSGAITGVVARLEDAGYLRRAPDLEDGRKQILSAALDRTSGVHAVFKTTHAELAAELRDLDTRQLSAIAEFLERSSELIYRQIGHLRSESLAEVGLSPSAARARLKARR